MEIVLEKEIARQARKSLDRQSFKKWQAAKSAQRFEKRTGMPAIVRPSTPPAAWILHPHFDPRYCLKHKRYLAKTIWKKLQEGTYEPVPALLREIPKPNGEFRQIMIFSVPDAAVAKLFRSNLTHRNQRLFSSNSFGYRFDRNVLDAVLHIESILKGEKLFLIQYDFRKYFDSIPHHYLSGVIGSKRVFLSSMIERTAVSAFLRHRYATESDYRARNFKEKHIGTPQGSSISLFLANAAAHELDEELELRNGQFARYADDVVGVAYSYEDALRIASAFESFCARTGLKINLEKSPGIKLLSERSVEEIASIQHFDFLGHRFKRSDAGVKIMLTDKAIKRIRAKISRIIQLHLIEYPKATGRFNPRRVGRGFKDWDLVTCLNEIRRYIYGGLSEAGIEGLIHQNISVPQLKGLMGFYALLSDSSQLRALDGWLVNVLRRTLMVRYTLFAMHCKMPPVPTTKALILGTWYRYKKLSMETRCPSFIRGWRAARKFYFRHGIGQINPPRYYGY